MSLGSEILRTIGKKAKPNPKLGTKVYPVPAYRGLKLWSDGEPFGSGQVDGSQPQWFTSKPDVASEYARTRNGAIGVIAPVNLNLGKKVLYIDAKGELFHKLGTADGVENIISKEELENLGEFLDTDEIAVRAAKAGYDSVVFKNLRDPPTSNLRGSSSKPHIVYAILPKNFKGIRGRFANYRNTDKPGVGDDFLSGIATTIGLGGALGGGALASRNRET